MPTFNGGRSECPLGDGCGVGRSSLCPARPGTPPTLTCISGCTPSLRWDLARQRVSPTFARRHRPLCRGSATALVSNGRRSDGQLRVDITTVAVEARAAGTALGADRALKWLARRQVVPASATSFGDSGSDLFMADRLCVRPGAGVPLTCVNVGRASALDRMGEARYTTIHAIESARDVRQLAFARGTVRQRAVVSVEARCSGDAERGHTGGTSNARHVVTALRGCRPQRWVRPGG